MYTTIEADIENGRITGPESRNLPAMAHVLITLLKKTEKNPTYDFSGLSGRLKWSGDAVKQQREMRDEW